MAGSADKVIVANRSGMIAKYGKAGVTRIGAALKRLVAADAKRGLTTVLVEIDDAAQMAKHGGAAIVNASDQAGSKRAVDALYNALSPDYVMLLDGPDVIPHIGLNPIPGLNDGDATIDSDLPYACAAGHSKTASNFLGVTRVVGRLPMTAGSKDSKAFAALIDRCATHKATARKAFDTYFAISADVWTVSTQLSLSTLFGGHGKLLVSPPSTHAGIDKTLGGLSHFINCHGGSGDPQFYGEKSGAYPMAMESLQTGAGIKPGTVAAAECCYGAQLYDNAMIGNAEPICMAYLHAGATAFMGSTTIAYGPAASNAQADLICQYFLEGVLAGASTGRAMLQARQRFVAKSSMAGATNLKTLAQFVLLGDPSLVAVDVPAGKITPEAAVVADAVASKSKAAVASDDQSMRKLRRVEMRSEGLSLADSAAKPGPRAAHASAGVARARSIAREHGFTVPGEVYEVTGGAKFRDAAKSLDREQQVMVMVEPKPNAGPLPLYRTMVAYIVGDGIAGVEIAESR